MTHSDRSASRTRTCTHIYTRIDIGKNIPNGQNVYLCCLRLSCRLKDFPQTSQVKVTSSLWLRSWIMRLQGFVKRRWQYLQTNSTVHLARIFCRRPNSLPCPSVSIGIIANILINSHRSFSWSTLCLLSLYLLSRGPANASSHSLHTGYRPITASLSLLSRQGARFLFFPLRASSLLLGPSLTMLSLSLSLSFFLRVALLLLRKSSPDRLTPAK